jgi:signal transduction histidine kinase
VGPGLEFASVDHAEHLIGALLLLARNERELTVHDEVDLATVAEDVLDTAHLGDRRVHATLDPAHISRDSVLVERLIANLVDNAVRYNTAAGDIWVSTRTITGKSHPTVANTGALISPVGHPSRSGEEVVLADRPRRRGVTHPIGHLSPPWYGWSGAIRWSGRTACGRGTGGWSRRRTARC